MSDEMAVGDNASSEEPKVGADDVAEEAPVAEQSSKQSAEPPAPESGDTEESNKGLEEKSEVKVNDDDKDIIDKDEKEEEEDKRGIKRRASAAFSDDGDFKGFEQTDKNDLTEFNKIIDKEWKFLRRYSTDEDFKGFDRVEMNNLTGYNKILERLETEISEAEKSFTPLRNISTSLQPVKASKRPRQDTDSSRPSSALSSRSDGDGAVSTDASSSPLGRGRRPTTEMSSPLLRVPLERGWKRELVYRAAHDAHSRRNADIYYYSPAGKKLRSTREVSEHLSGTGLTLENFSFFKEPLGIDDPEKEIIRDAKLMRRVESPVAAPTPVEGKRTPKPKPPKGASPEPNTPKSPPSKIKVKSMGSRLNNNSSPATPQPPPASKQPRRQSAQAQPTQPTQPTQPQPAAADNNNTAAWKKPRTALPPLHARPQTATANSQVGRVGQQPCSLSCGRAVPSLACAACLCLYHPACLGLAHAPPHPFHCKNCETSAPRDPPPLIHKSGVASNTGLQTPTPITPTNTNQSANISNLSANVSANKSANVSPNTVPVPRRVLVPSKQRSDKRVLLRMKMSGGADGQKVWAVSPSATGANQHGHNVTVAPTAPVAPVAPIAPVAPTTPVAPIAPVIPIPLPNRQTLPQSLAVINGRRFIVVARGQQN